MTDNGKVVLLCAVLTAFALALAPGCSDDVDSQEETCPANLADGCKTFLESGNGDAARACFLDILEIYPECADGHFGVALADELRFIGIVDKLLSHILDPLEEKGPIDVGAIIVDYAENLLEPVVREILEHLDHCLKEDSLRFDLERFPLEILGLEFLVYVGEYDKGDVFLHSAEFNIIAAAIDTILSADLSFDFQIVIDHIECWEGMEALDIVLDVINMVLEILFDPAFPDFLRLRDDGLWRMPRAGLEMGHAFDLFNQAVDTIREEGQDRAHDVSGCADRNGNEVCDPDEFIHGLIYSLPSGLQEELQLVETALRDSYWDNTELDSNPDSPAPFTLDRLNPVLEYLGLPPFFPSLAIDFSSMYQDPDPAGIRKQVKLVFIFIRLLLELLPTDALLPEAGRGDEPEQTWRNTVPDGPPAVGLDTVTDIAALPYLRPKARTLQFSSHDPAGGNDDGFTPPNHLYIDDNGEFVVFDQYGPGCIYRMWFTAMWSFIGNIRIYVDDMSAPVAEGPFWLFYFSAFEPFVEPLIGNWFTSSGGCISYLPVPFEQRCKITLNVPPEFFSITYVRYDGDTQVTSYTGTEDYSHLSTIFENPGADPKPDVPSSTLSGSASLEAGGGIELMNMDGPGAVWRLFIDIEPFDQEVVQDLWLTAWWDGEGTPSVEAPVSEFFGSFYINDSPKSMLIGHDCERFYCYFPMPFRYEGNLAVENRSDVALDLTWEVIVADDEYAQDAGHFKAVYHEENPVAAGRDYGIAMRGDTAGKYVGISHTMRGPLSRGYLEGDERFYADGSFSPSLHGTGTEDYYNSGWYFMMGTYSRPLWGNPSHRVFPDYDMTGTYRLHVGDAVHYLDGVRLGIEHGGSNHGESEHYSSVAYFYESEGSRLRLTDTFDVGDAADESAHDYTALEANFSGPLTSFYEGEDDEEPVTDSGMAVRGESTFTIAIDQDNIGIILRRKYDQFNGRQQAEILVDGLSAGRWYTPERSETLRWAEDDFSLPASLTSGKTAVQVTIRPEGAVPWTEFFYRVYSVLSEAD
ncbi:glycoside hydrolase family 172 protein [Thermodesulfobacteriota bacterium]